MEFLCLQSQINEQVQHNSCWQMLLALTPFALGALNLILKVTLENPDPPENVIEWIFALLMHVYFLLTWFNWRATGFDGRFTVCMKE